MRDIKFRAWDKEQRKMYFFDEVEVNHEYNLLGFHAVGSSNFGDLEMSYDFEPMQYTGLKDKNGKEIYEGDILHTQDGYAGDTEIKSTNLQVVFDKGEFYLCKGKGTFDYLSLFDGIGNFQGVVIGNIYETPDLLKGEV